jgi:hypothetical protein
MPNTAKQPPDRKPRKTFWQPPEERDRVTDEMRRWQEENAEAIKAWNEYIDKNGLPLEKYRQF